MPSVPNLCGGIENDFLPLPAVLGRLIIVDRDSLLDVEVSVNQFI